jgi:thymidylate kinase
MLNKRGKFITFEGGDGCGKSTQIRLAANWLQKSGFDFLLMREPGGTIIGEKIREILLDPDNDEMTDMTEMLLYAAARAQLAREVIEPSIAAGKLVICDRWVDSSMVYQGGARGLGEVVRTVNTIAAGDLFSPDATIFLDLDPEEALKRAKGESGGDRIEALGIEYQKKVRQAYLELASIENTRVHVIDACGTPEEVHSRVLSALEAILAKDGPDV